MLKVLMIVSFSVAALITGCSSKKEKDDSSFFLLSLLFQQDRAENYDREVEIVTHAVPPTIPNSSYSFDLSYTDQDLEYYKSLLRAQIAKYPRGYWIKGRAEKIFLVKYILSPSGGAKGLSNAMNQNSIILSVGESLPGCNCDDQLISTIHHELTHNVDFARLGYNYYTQPDWSLLNPSGFQYGSLSPNDYPQWTDLVHPISGFLSYYSSTNALEDRAVIASALFGDSALYANLLNWCSTDFYLSRKAHQLASDLNRFWPFEGPDTFWKTRLSGVLNACN
ncbi:hypothetical protein EHQ67_04640 [Leptospira kmetyi]|nr:hypothetical protein [Leptospira kmetyi]TGL71158.1 hypothetical protein EHQ67_04640 [Leptospira kmetyi]